jgi:hypothetical protein
VPAPADERPDLPADAPAPDELNGFWRADDSGETFLINQDRAGLRASRGQAWVCRPAGPARPAGVADGYPLSDEHFQVQRSGDQLRGELQVCWFGGGEDPNWAPAALQLTLGADHDSLAGSWRDDLGNQEVALHLSRLPVTPVSAEDFGLPAVNLRIHDYGVKRVARLDGTVVTVSEEYDLSPDTDIEIVRHTGIDFSSRNENWVVAPLPFATPIGGRIYVYPGSPWNTIAVLLETGDQLQFQHAGEIRVQTGEQVAAGTILGVTGATGTSVIHLHVQAKNSTGDFVSPDWVVARVRGIAPG